MISAMTNARLERLLNDSVLSPIRSALGPNILHHTMTKADVQGIWLGEKLVDDGFLSGEELARILATELHLPLLDLTRRHPDPEALALLERSYCLQQSILPLTISEQGLELVMANPLDTEVIECVKTTTARKVAIRIAPPTMIAEMIQACYVQPVDRPRTLEVERPIAPALLNTPPVLYRYRGAQRPSDDAPPYPFSIFDLLAEVTRLCASDLHLTAGTSPRVRIHGRLQSLPIPRLTPQNVFSLANAMMTHDQWEELEHELELDFSFGLQEIGRFRANIFLQRGTYGVSLRAIPNEIPTLESLGMPEVLRTFAFLEHGLVLVTGPTGSGKSTTLAAIVHEMNLYRRGHIMTLEDPIEFVHWHKQCIINQRQVGMDTRSFLAALKRVLRQDPDVILIGELRDLETITAAMSAAETGHLVLSTLHTNSAMQTIDRIIDVFPADQQSQIRTQLASVIEGVVSQRLILNSEGSGRVCAQEILVATPAVRTMIRDAKTYQIINVLESGAQYGMQTMNKALQLLLEQNSISLAEALRHGTDKEALQQVCT